MSIPRLLRTVRYLKPQQIVNRLTRKLRRPQLIGISAPPRRAMTGGWLSPIPKAISMLGPRRFRFLNVERSAGMRQSWNDAATDKLWLYNLHYFDDLNANQADARRDWHTALMDAWIDENPPGQGAGWEPYTLSLRIVNWIKWGLATNELSIRMLDSLAEQVRSLSQQLEFHLLGNHLWANAKALIFAGAFFDGPEAERLLKMGTRLLTKQIDEQILSDGGHFERSAMYHAILTEDVLDLINLARAYPNLRDLPPVPLKSCARRMIAWLNAMTHPDGRIPFFNDAAFGIAAEPLQIHEYATALELECEKQAPKGLLVLKDTGYCRMALGQAVALFDAAPIGPDYLPGHAHADTLSFELSVFGQRVVVNCGTSIYGESAQRHLERSTASHSTVVVNDENSSEVWAGFRVGRRARARLLYATESQDGIEVSATHDGYRRGLGGSVHRRTLRLQPTSLEVRDQVTGAARSAVAHFHFPAGLRVLVAEDCCSGQITLSTGDTMNWASVAPAKVAPSEWRPEFGVRQPSWQLQIPLQNAESRFHLSWTSR